MQKLLLLLCTFLVTGILQSQTNDSQFTTEFNGGQTLVTSSMTLDCEYCLRGTMFFYDTATGKKLYWDDFNSYSLQKFAVPSKVMKQLSNTVSFKLYLTMCSDSKLRIIDSQGIRAYADEEFTMSVYETYENAIAIPLDTESIANVERKKEFQRKEEQKKIKAEQELVANENRTIKVGDLLYICNGGAPCEVIAREVTPTKIKVEFISQCYPENRGNISRWTHISQGHQKWLEKKYIYGKEKVNCSGKQSAVR